MIPETPNSSFTIQKYFHPDIVQPPTQHLPDKLHIFIKEQGIILDTKLTHIIMWGALYAAQSLSLK